MRYTLEYKDIPSTTWKPLVDASANTTPVRHLRHGADMCGPADDPGHDRERRGRNLRVQRVWGERQPCCFEGQVVRPMWRCLLVVQWGAFAELGKKRARSIDLAEGGMVHAAWVVDCGLARGPHTDCVAVTGNSSPDRATPFPACRRKRGPSNEGEHGHVGSERPLTVPRRRATEDRSIYVRVKVPSIRSPGLAAVMTLAPPVWTSTGTTELTDPAMVTMTAANAACDDEAPTEEVESPTTGETSLKHADGHLHYNGKSPKSRGACYAVRATAADVSNITTQFKLR